MNQQPSFKPLCARVVPSLLCALAALVAHSHAQAAPVAKPEVRSTLIASSATQVLDVALVRVTGETHDAILLLRGDGVELTAAKAEQAPRPASSVAIPPPRVTVRDLRGRLAIRQWPRFDVYLPGRSCNGVFSPQLTLTCQDNNDPWPLGSSLLADDELEARFPFTRNFFDGELSGRLDTVKVAPFYAAAHWHGSTPAASLWLLTGIDGHVRSLTAATATATKEFASTGWGSDITRVTSHCGAGEQLLVTAAADGAQPDSVQAVELTGDNSHPIAPPLSMPGPITTLWPDAVGQSAIAVVRNLKTGAYDAYRLEVACDR